MHQQRGMTFIGLVLMIAGIVLVAVIGLKLAPAYIEYFSVKKAIIKISNDPAFEQMSKSDVAAAFNRSAVIDNIRVVSGADLELGRDEAGQAVVSVEYQTVVPLIANVSALLDFSTSSSGASGG